MLNRRYLMKIAATLSMAPWLSARANDAPFVARLHALEQQLGGRLGVCASSAGRQLGWRSDERFPVCSTFKALLAGAVLNAFGSGEALQRVVQYGKADLVAYSPQTQNHLETGMAVGELCAAAVQYSDNTAANLLLREIGGPAALTAYARALGDNTFRLDRWETELNTAVPGDERDTSTPGAMAKTLERLLLGNALAAPQRAQLKAWMLGNTTGAARIRAGVPADWSVADKTGTGDYASASDVGVAWRGEGTPVVIAIYTTQPSSATATPRNDIIAEAARVVAEWAQA